MTNPTMEERLEKLLSLSLLLEKSVLDAESDPDDWVDILEERQQVMDQIQTALAEGATVSDTDKQNFLAKAYEIDQRILPIMEGKKLDVQDELHKLQKKKLAQKQYHGSAISAYGAFFDRKK